MKITRKHILGVGSDTSLVNLGWDRPNTPNTQDGKEKIIDSVEIEISHKRNKLRQYINKKSEYIMCFVHFDVGTENLDGIYLSVWDENTLNERNIDSSILNDEEKEMIIEYALTELRECR